MVESNFQSFLPSIIQGMGYNSKISANLMSGNVLYIQYFRIYIDILTAPPYIGAVVLVTLNLDFDKNSTKSSFDNDVR